MRVIDFSELEEKIRGIPLMQKDTDGSEIFPYKNAHINLQLFHADEVNPPTFYLLEKNLQTQKLLHAALLNLGYNFLHLTDKAAALEIFNKDSNEFWTLIPPIIELTSRTVRYVPQSNEINYEHMPTKIMIQLICDGAHRVAFSQGHGELFTGIKISGADPLYPYYAHPNGWDMVKIVKDVPATKEEKKYYRLENCYALYRNFDIIGCGKPRYTPEGKNV